MRILMKLKMKLKLLKMMKPNKEESSKLKKYFKNRYVTFLKSLKEENNKKKEEEEKARQKEERLKNKMLQKLGIENVRSRFMTDPSTHPASKDESRVKRSASIASKTKSNSEMSRTNYNKYTGTPKNSIRNRLNEVKEFDEKLAEERKKEAKAKKDANERIKKKQEDYLKSLAEKKRIESEKEEEEKKRKEIQRQNLRAKVKGMLDGLERKPKVEEDEQEEQKEVRKMEQADIDDFLKRNLQKKKVHSNITDFDVWKKRNRVGKKTKVFICSGGYGTIRKNLAEKGWVENKDSNSP